MSREDRLSSYDYELPERLIAQEPLARRDASRLLVLRFPSGEVTHRRFDEAPDLLRRGDLLVLNDTRVSARRLIGRRTTGGAVEALVLSRLGDGAYEALLKPSKRIRSGERIDFDGGLAATIESDDPSPTRRLRFEGDPDLARFGSVPLPPYIRRDLADSARYDTTYARAPGSAAAPTAGLHFTPDLFARLTERSVGRAAVTLHVGLDTFRPVATEDLADHRMHGEEAAIGSETAATVNAAERVIAVGTTSVRTLESFAEPDRSVSAGRMRTDLFIRPGYAFRVVAGMFTNFHLPRTTMLAMISALAGRENVLRAYAEAVAKEYRFLSFGDSMLILPDEETRG